VGALIDGRNAYVAIARGYERRLLSSES